MNFLAELRPISVQADSHLAKGRFFLGFDYRTYKMECIAVVSVFSLIVAFAWGSSLADAKTPEAVDLARLNDWDIVVAEDAIPSEIYAAEEFQKCFGRASRVKLPIVRKVDGLDRHVIIGPSQAMRASNLGFDVHDFGYEDLRIVIRGGSIAIVGIRPRGRLYGVYTFLEDYLDVRFLRDEHTHVTAVGQQQTIGPVDRVYRAPFANLRPTGYKAPYHYVFFGVRTRNNGFHDQPRFGGTSPFGNTNHSFYR